MSKSIFALPGWTKGTFSGITYSYLRIKPSSDDKPTFVCFHGFPNGPLAYRKIVPKLIAQGYGVILPELLGYGGTDKPGDITAYSRISVSESVAEIVAFENVNNVIVLGHDWGVSVASRFAVKHADIVKAVILAGVPYSAPSANVFPTAYLNKTFQPILGFEPYAYMEWFVTDEAPQLISEHLESFVHALLNEDIGRAFCARGILQSNLPKDIKLPCASWVKEEDIQELLSYLKRNDMNSLLNWYRSVLLYVDERENELPKRLTSPYLYLACEKDPTIPSGLAEQRNKYADNLTVKSFPTGHWLLEEDPEVAWRAIEDWLLTAM